MIRSLITIKSDNRFIWKGAEYTIPFYRRENFSSTCEYYFTFGDISITIFVKPMRYSSVSSCLRLSLGTYRFLSRIIYTVTATQQEWGVQFSKPEVHLYPEDEKFPSRHLHSKRRNDSNVMTCAYCSSTFQKREYDSIFLLVFVIGFFFLSIIETC